MKPSLDATLRVLRDYPEGITQMDALLEYGLRDSLAQRVHELRHMGFDVRDRWVERNGERVKQYYLVERPLFAGQPLTRPRLCPGCHQPHAAGRTCDFTGAVA